MKKFLNRHWFIITGLSLSLHVSAETEFLPTITIEGQGTRPGQIAVTPESGGALDSALLLKRVPGGNVNRNGPLTNIPQYRGLFGNRVGVQVNGLSVQEVGPNSMDTRSSSVPKSLVKSIKVYRGIAPVSAGMETLGGAIEINSRRSEFGESGTPEFHGFVNAGYSWVDFGRYYGGMLGLSNDRHRLNAGGNIEKATITNSKAINRSDQVSMIAKYFPLVMDLSLLKIMKYQLITTLRTLGIPEHHRCQWILSTLEPILAVSDIKASWQII
jgi:iron complex outermembrane receptor protein